MFDIKAFEKATLTQRAFDVPVPGLVEWFGVSDDQREHLATLITSESRDKYAIEIGVVWPVRGLTDDELERCAEDARGNRQKLADVFAEVMQINGADVDEIKEKLGVGESVNARTALRAEHVYRGSVNPISIRVAYKLGRAFPVEFRMLADKIMELSGLGGGRRKKAESLWRDPAIKAALALCDLRGAFLFQTRPDLFPGGKLSQTEIELWGRYHDYRDKQRKRK